MPVLTNPVPELSTLNSCPSVGVAPDGSRHWAATGTLLQPSGMVTKHECSARELLAPMLNRLPSITDVSTKLEQCEGAESYAQSGTQVPGELLNPFTGPGRAPRGAAKVVPV